MFSFVSISCQKYNRFYKATALCRLLRATRQWQQLLKLNARPDAEIDGSSINWWFLHQIIISSQVSISHHRWGTDIYFDFLFLAYNPKGIALFIEKRKKSLRANASTRIHLRSWKPAIWLSLSISLALYQIVFHMSAGIQSTIIANNAKINSYTI